MTLIPAARHVASRDAILGARPACSSASRSRNPAGATAAALRCPRRAHSADRPCTRSNSASGNSTSGSNRFSKRGLTLAVVLAIRLDAQVESRLRTSDRGSRSRDRRAAPDRTASTPSSTCSSLMPCDWKKRPQLARSCVAVLSVVQHAQPGTPLLAIVGAVVRLRVDTHAALQRPALAQRVRRVPVRGRLEAVRARAKRRRRCSRAGRIREMESPARRVSVARSSRSVPTGVALRAEAMIDPARVECVLETQPDDVKRCARRSPADARARLVDLAATLVDRSV